MMMKTTGKLFFEAAPEYDETIKYVAAADAREALLYLNDTANALPDFIFLDLRMPGLSGEQCLIEIKKRYPAGFYSCYHLHNFKG